MAEVLVEFSEPIASDGVVYSASAWGARAADGLWHGWIEFTSLDGRTALRSGRETTQPDKHSAVYWATGLGAVYLEGALQRALNPRLPDPVHAAAAPDIDIPRPARSTRRS